MIGILNWKILGFRYLVSHIAWAYVAATDPRGSAVRIPAFRGWVLGVDIVDPAMCAVCQRIWMN